VGLETCDTTPLAATGTAPSPIPTVGCARLVAKRQASFRSLADTLHGRTIMNTNAPETLVASVLDESSAYYLLGFERTNPVEDGREHTIEVKTRRSGLTLYWRKGYVSAKPDSAARPVQTASTISGPNLAAVTGVLPKTGLSLGV